MSATFGLMPNGELRVTAPCPFPDCGHSSTLMQQDCIGRWHAWCHECGAQGPAREDKAAAIAAWNRRPSAAAIEAALRHLMSHVDEVRKVVEWCGSAIDEGRAALNSAAPYVAGPDGMHPSANPAMYDAGQHRLNGSYCYHVESRPDGLAAKYCGRAERWSGHGLPDFHKFVAAPTVPSAVRQLADLVRRSIAEEDAAISWSATFEGDLPSNRAALMLYLETAFMAGAYWGRDRLSGRSL
jgi:Lar family restriction alleviation protein